jgi:hypothetical protein
MKVCDRINCELGQKTIIDFPLEDGRTPGHADFPPEVSCCGHPVFKKKKKKKKSVTASITVIRSSGLTSLVDNPVCNLYIFDQPPIG